MTVHNHGPEDGPGLACPETVVDGQLRGQCMNHRPFTEAELFTFWYGEDNRKPGVECNECGAAVIDTERHTAWHNKVADL